MKDMAIQGIIRGKPHRTTIPDKKQPCPMDKVNRQFRVPAPNRLWVSDFTYVATWKGFVYVAFVIDAFARKIVGWRVSTSPHAGFVLDVLEQAVHERRPVKGMGLVHHSDRGSQYLSIKYTERLAEAGIEPHVPVFDKSARRDGTFERNDFIYDHRSDTYACPAGKTLKPRRRDFAKPRSVVNQDDFIRYRASSLDCGACPLKPRCCPNTPERKVSRSIHEGARDMARGITASEAFAVSSRLR